MTLRYRENMILKMTFQFSLLVMDYVELLEERKKFVIANQLLKSGTSIGANVHEAQNAESIQDFIHKFKLAAKEADETRYWLLLCQHSGCYPSCNELLDKLENIGKVITKIIASSKKN